MIFIIILVFFAGFVRGVFESDKFTLNYTDYIDSTEFSIISKIKQASDVYFAFGLSYDQIMVRLP